MTFNPATIFITAFIFLLLLFLVEFLKRRFRLPAEITRKISHVFGGLGVIWLSGFLNRQEYLFLTAVFLVIFILHYKYKTFQSLAITNRITYGEITYILGLGMFGFFLFEQREKFILGLLLLIIPDAVAGLTTIITQRNNKNLYHFIIYGLCAFLILSKFQILPSPIFISLIRSLTEYVSPYGLDNFTVPLIYTFLIL